ncbi:hypothetical protein LX36DRAFT_698337 [Colletotrichum falcatum]|nr:hypothetical protein LX36DRAFT_698337 [Colletotrichum falcatum]
MPPGTIVGILQHVTCSFHFHRDLRVLKEPQMMIPNPFFGPDPNDNVEESSSTQDSGVFLTDDEVIAGVCPRQQECLDDKTVPSYAVMRLLEAGLDALIVDRRPSVNIQTIQAMTSPPLAHLVPEVFNIRIQSLASRSRLLPGLSSVFAVLDKIEPSRMEDLIEDRAGNRFSQANEHSSENLWHQLWRLTRTRLPSFQRGNLEQRRARETAAADNDGDDDDDDDDDDDGTLPINEVERSAGYQPLSKDRTFADKEPNHEVDTQIGACESYDIDGSFSDYDMRQHDEDVDELVPEANDAFRYSSPFPSMDDVSIRYDGEADDDKACYVGHSVNHDGEFASFSSGDISSPFVPFSGEANPEGFEVKGLNQADLVEDRKSSRSPMSISQNDAGGLEGSGDAYWELSQTCWHSPILLEEVEVEDQFEDEWAV